MLEKSVGVPNEYYVTGTDNYTKYLVENVICVGRVNVLRGCNISLDRFLTSVGIVDWLLEGNIIARDIRINASFDND